MLQSNLSNRIRDEDRRSRSIRGVIPLIGGVILMAIGITLAIRSSSHVPKVGSLVLPSAIRFSPTPATSIAAASPDAGKFPAPDTQAAAESNELGQTLEEFQAEYEALSGKAGGQETFFKKSVGKKVFWTVRVDHVFRTGAGVIVVFSSTQRPDWAAFPISDARFPARLEKQLMTLSRGDIIRIEGKLVYLGIKTLECSYFEIVQNEAPSH